MIIQLMQEHHEQENKNTGRWSQDEHQRFMYAIMQYGKDWKKVQDYVKTRTGSQVRSHAQKFFGKLQKGENEHRNAHPQAEFSQTELDFERQANNEATPCTPIQLVSLIKRQQKQEGKINILNFKKTLQDRHMQENEVDHMPQSLQRSNSYKSLSNILSAYEEVNNKKQEMQNEDESFFIELTKKYKRFFNMTEDFDKLIDLHKPVKEAIQQMEKGARKRSFTLPEGSELEGDQLDQKIQEIKKKIKAEPTEKKPNRTYDKLQVNTTKQSRTPTNCKQKQTKLSTIPENPKQQELICSRQVLPSPQHKETPL